MRDIMTFERMNEEQRKFMTFDQAQLVEKRLMKNEGSGLLILGIPLLILGIANQTFLGVLYDTLIMQILVTVGAILIGVMCCMFGLKFMKKKKGSIAEGICRINGNLYTVEEVCDFFREVREEKDVVIFLADKRKIKEEDQGYAGLFTNNWMKIPNQPPADIAKFSDVVAAWHDEKGDTGYGYVGLYILRIDGQLYGMDCHPNFSKKVMEELGKRNPLTILARRFTYEGRTYDVCSNKEQVIQIYKQNLDRQFNTAVE